MKTAVMVAAALWVVAGVGYAEEYKHSEWDSWNAFGEGSSTTMETETSGMKMKMTTTLKKKEADKITLSTAMEMSGTVLPAQERVVTKPKDDAKPAEAKCPKCNKDAKSHAKMSQKEEKVKVGDKEVACTVVDAVMSDCDGKETAASKTYFSKSVPGGMVKMEGKMGGVENKMTCTSFEAKK